MFSAWYFDILINLIATIIIIWVSQELWTYLLDNFSKKRTKDLVNGQLEKYKRIIEESRNPCSPTSDFISPEEKNNMNQDLLDFINSEL